MRSCRRMSRRANASLDAAEDDVDPCVLEGGTEEVGELPVPVPGHESCPEAQVFEVHDEVFRRLRYPGCGGMCGGRRPAKHQLGSAENWPRYWSSAQAQGRCLPP